MTGKKTKEENEIVAKYDYERTSDYIEYSDVLHELIDYLPKLDKIMIEQGGVL